MGTFERAVTKWLEVSEHLNKSTDLVEIISNISRGRIIAVRFYFIVHTIEIDDVSQQILKEGCYPVGNIRKIVNFSLGVNVEVCTDIIAHISRIRGISYEFSSIEDVVFNAAI